MFRKKRPRHRLLRCRCLSWVDDTGLDLGCLLVGHEVREERGKGLLRCFIEEASGFFFVGGGGGQSFPFCPSVRRSCVFRLP